MANFCCLVFKLVHSPPFVKRLNSNYAIQRSLSNITPQETICGVEYGLGNTALRAITRHSVSSVIAYVPKKHNLQVQVLAAMKDALEEAEISTRQLLADLHAKSACGISLQSFDVGSSNDQIEFKNIQVFISFRGETRTGFTGHLYRALTQAGYRTFIDELMRRGENVERELIKTIRNSKVSVIVISPGYASSQSCLDELVEILRCRRCFGHKVLPVFYHVCTNDVKNQIGIFGAAFDDLVKRLEDATDKRVNRWKKALKGVTRISGRVLHPYEYETYFIDQIVADVEKLLGNAPQQQYVPSSVVGWHSFIHGFNSWLQTAPCILSYIVVECAGIVAASKYLVRRFNESLMVIWLGIAVTLYLRSVKPTEKLKNDRPSKQS